MEYRQTLQPKDLHKLYHVTYLIKSSDEVVKVGRDFAKLVSTKDLVNELHLLNVGEQVPVVNGEMSGNFTRTVSLWEGGHWFLVLVGKWGLCVCVHVVSVLLYYLLKEQKEQNRLYTILN